MCPSDHRLASLRKQSARWFIGSTVLDICHPNNPFPVLSPTLFYITGNTIFLPASFSCQLLLDSYAAAAAAAAKSLESCPALCDPIDGSPPGSPVPGILQARTLEWVAISFSNALK